MKTPTKECKCVICGHVGFVPEYQAWIAHGHKWPDIFICDVCEKELN